MVAPKCNHAIVGCMCEGLGWDFSGGLNDMKSVGTYLEDHPKVVSG